MKTLVIAFSTFSTLVLLALPQDAWPVSTVGHEEISPAFWVILSLAIITSLVALWSVLRRREAIIRSNEAEAIIQFSDAVLEEGSLAYFTIHNGTTCFCSPRLRRWLGLSESIISLKKLEETGREITQNEESISRLFKKIYKLVNEGKEFTNTFNQPNINKIYLARGSRAKNDINKSRQFDVVWFSNVTELDQGHSNLIAQLSESISKHTMLSHILDVAPFPIWSRNKDLSLGWVNNSYASAVEKENATSVVTDQIELVIDAKKRPLQEIAKRALKENKEQVEKHFVIMDGKRHSLQVHEVPLPSEEFETVGFAVDVTRSEFLEAELDQHKTAHAETLDKLSTPVAIFGPDTTLVFYNNAFNELWQLPTEWLNTEPTHGDFLEALRERRQVPEQSDFPAWKNRILSQYIGLLEPAEETWHLPNGTVLRVVTQPHPIGGTLVLFEDVTDSLALERSYNTLIEVQRETLENLHESVAVFGGDGRLKLFNSNYAKLWGITPEFLNAEPHIKEVAQKSKKMLDNQHQDWTKVKENLVNIANSREQRSGQWTLSNEKVVEYSIVPLPDGASLFTLSNETSKARITAALEDRNKAMKEADNLKSEFIANMSYELRTPLNSIIGFSEILDLENFGELNPKQKDYINAILSSSLQLKYLIDDILDLSIIEAGKMELDIEDIDIKQALVNSVALTIGAAKDKGVSVKLLKIQVSNTFVECDLRRITHAIQTIITDGISRTGAGGNVEVALLGDKNTVSICVSDTRQNTKQFKNDNRDLIGLSSEYPTNKKMNLSLSLVDSFVKIHGGKLTISTDKNNTRTVTCSLPRKTLIKRPVANA
jgi:signal transduction histidine kinase